MSERSVRERELALALARIERMSRPIRSSNGSIIGIGKVECGSLAEASRIAREVLYVEELCGAKQME